MKNKPLDHDEPKLPQSPEDIYTPDFPDQPAPKRKPRDGEVVPSSEQKTKAGIIAPNIGREARNDENEGQRWKTPLEPRQRKAGNALAARFARVSGSTAQRRENMAAAIHDGFRNAAMRDAETAELSQDSEHLTQLGFGKSNR